MGAPQYEQAGADIGGTGTTNTIPRWTGPSTLGDSGLIDNGTAIYTTTRNVGIGTASPGYRLDVAGTTGTGFVAARFKSEYATAALVGTDSSSVWFGLGAIGNTNCFQVGTNFLNFRTNGADVARIDSAGRVLVGLTASNQNSAQLQVSADASGALGGEIVVRNGAADAASNTARVTFKISANYGQAVDSCRIDAYRSTAGANLAGLKFWTYGGAGIATALTIDETQNVILGSTTGATIQAAGSQQGLKLPATPGNADTQTLDAYKEGTFTATLKGGTSDPTTPVTVTGNYVLVGKTMTVTVYFANVTTTGAAGNVYITTDLAAALRPGTRGTAAVGLEVFTTGAGVGSFIDVRTDGTFYLLENFNNGGTAIGQHNAGTNRYLWFTATYIIA